MYNVACGNGFPLGIPTGDGGGGGASAAENVSYDNSDSGLTAENVQTAIDELAGDISAPAASDVSYDNTDSGLTADDVQEAIDELAGDISTLAAANVSYDNTSSGLTADDVQEAIDELAGDIGTLAAADVSYDNTSSGLTADDVQEAIDELADSITANTYSTTETEIGTWNDAKLYRKVVPITGGLPNNSTINVSTGLVNDNVTIRSFFSFAWTSNGNNIITLPYVSLSGNHVSILKGILGTEVVFQITSITDVSSYVDGHIIIEYTKN